MVKVRTLDRYVARRFIVLYLASLLSFTILYVLIDSVSQYWSFMGKSKSFADFLSIWSNFYLAQVPILFCRVLGPVTAVASAGFTVTLFARSNEIPPILSAGISARRLLVPIFAISALATLATVAVQEVWIPAQREWIREARSFGRGKWSARHVKFFEPEKRVLVQFRVYDRKELNGQGVLAFTLGGQPGRKFLIEAREARWIEAKDRPGRWMLRDGFIQEYDEDWNLIPAPPPVPSGSTPPASGTPPADPAANRLFTPFEERALDEIAGIEMLPQDLEENENLNPFLWLSELWGKVQRSSDSERWRIRLYTRIADPLHALILVLLGLPVILSRGTRNIFLSAIATIVVSTLYFVSYVVLLNLGNRGLLSPGLAAGLAPVLFASLGITLLFKMPS